uniref:Uncharacterized protein n=1 Tax=Sipha flava TaxID=143950 RepID=A0A2S2PYL6_9HEMI
MLVHPFRKRFLLYGVSFIGYAEDSSVGRVQLQYAERFVLCPLLEALVRVEVHDWWLSNNSSAVCGYRPVYGQHRFSSGRHRRRCTAQHTRHAIDRYHLNGPCESQDKNRTKKKKKKKKGK